MFAQRLRRNRGSVLVAMLLSVAALFAALVAVPITNSALSAQVKNTTNTASTNGYYTCQAAAMGSAGVAPFFIYPLNESSGAAGATDSSGSSHSGVYSSSGITYGSSGPCPRDYAKAITLDGSSGSLYCPTLVSTAPTVFSEEIWFKTTTGGGKLIGFGNQSTGSSTHYDRHLFLTNAGNLVFGVYNSTAPDYHPITSSATYLDGKWHDAVATFGPSTDANAGMRLYVDGVLVASDPTTTVAEAAGSGYWRIGYDNINTWPNAPTDYYFTGSLAFASVYTYTLSAAQVAAHYRAGF